MRFVLLWSTLLVCICSCWSLGNREQCDLIRSLRIGESYEVHTFPVTRKRGRYMAGYRHADLALAPEECTWAFKANGNCALEFWTCHYERGDVDCSEQYLLIGDEYSQKRICGFRKPPKRFQSAGSRLFLSHYSRNEDHKTVNSHLSGAVHCVKRTPPELSHPYIETNSSTGMNCTSNFTNSVGVITRGDVAPPNFIYVINATIDGESFQGVFPCGKSSCTFSSKIGSDSFELACTTLLNPEGNCQGPILKCPRSGNCTVVANDNRSHSNTLTCSPAAGEFCAFQLFACFR